MLFLENQKQPVSLQGGKLVHAVRQPVTEPGNQDLKGGRVDGPLSKSA